MATLALAGGAASASLVNNGTYTTDTVSMLDWLDISQTAGLSGNQVNSALAGSLAGWRMASRAQVLTLWNHAGIRDTDQFLGGDQFTAVDGLLELIQGTLDVGTTGRWYDGVRLQGMTSDACCGGYNWAPSININRVNNTAWAFSYHYNPGPTAYPDFRQDWGYWLVRDSQATATHGVPEPGSLALAALAMAGAAVARRRTTAP